MEYIAAADELPIEEELRVGGPFTVELDLFPNDVILQHIDRLVIREPVFLEQLHYEIGIAAAWWLRGAFHEQADFVIFHHFVDYLLCVFGGQLVLFFRCETTLEQGEHARSMGRQSV